ncbi:hypothetical protein PanWU01x14_305460 [Parasponia andersonii]|uniref:Wall-associated receptor kinase galacturonan-binding domain-containing protein n=1 Tax=Parasponia andersonii TaxID=3476 RepID=A0A2P5AS58_PARAD|nr:hypothetical protein PanWU01x14_305460 [Parasponia andersonii]
MKSGRSLSGGMLFKEHLLLILVIIMMLLFHQSSYADKNSGTVCSSSCGSIHNIKSPFRLTTDPLSCGDLRYNLSCENNILVLYLPVYQYSGIYERKIYYVQAINYNNYTIRVVDPNIYHHKDDCSSIPNNTLSLDDLYVRDSYTVKILLGLSYNESERRYPMRTLVDNVVFFNCESPALNSSYIDAAPCLFNDTFSTRRHYYSYYYVSDGSSRFNFSELEESCWIQQVTLIEKGANLDRSNASSDEIHKVLVYGFQLSWIQSLDKRTDMGRVCYLLNQDSSLVRCVSRCQINDYFDRSNSFECGKDILTVTKNLTFIVTSF